MSIRFDRLQQSVEIDAVLGAVIRVEVSTVSTGVHDEKRSIEVSGLLDTGASRTCLAREIVAHLGLAQTGEDAAHTQAGPMLAATHTIDLRFVGTSLAPKLGLAVSSLPLPFTMAAHGANAEDPANVGVLIGLDVLRSWHMTWDGPRGVVAITTDDEAAK